MPLHAPGAVQSPGCAVPAATQVPHLSPHAWSTVPVMAWQLASGAQAAPPGPRVPAGERAA
jgi:hypothetical protein